MEEECFIRSTAVETIREEGSLKGGVPAARTLFEAIESSTEFADARGAIGEPRRLLDVHVTINVAMQKGILHITLPDDVAPRRCNGQEAADRGKAGNRSISGTVIAARALHESFCHQPSFLNGVARAGPLPGEDPLGGNGADADDRIHQGPGAEFVEHG